MSATDATKRENVSKYTTDLEQKLANAAKLQAKNYGDKVQEERMKNDIDLELEGIAAARMKNNPMDSVTAGEGLEWVEDTATLGSIFQDFAKDERYAWLAALSAGRLPNIVRKDVRVPIAQDNPAARVGTEWTAVDHNTSTPTTTFGTADTLINQIKLFHSVGISERLELFGVSSTVQYVTSQTNDVFMKAVADAILNADNLAAGTGNINSKDQAAATTFGADDVKVNYNDGLRKQPVNGTVDVDFIDAGGTIDFGDLMDAAALMSFHSTPGSRFTVMDNRSYHFLMKQSEFKDFSVNNSNSTVETGVIANIGGMRVYVTDLMRAVDVDGLRLALAPNTSGQIIIAKGNVMPHLFAQNVMTKLHENFEKGFLLEAKSYFGFSNVNKKSHVEPSIVSVVNITS